FKPFGRCRSTCQRSPSGSVKFRLSARARRTVSFFSRRGGIYPSTMLRMVPLPICRWGGTPLVLIFACIVLRWLRRRGPCAAAAVAPALRRRRGGRGELGGAQPAVVVAIRALELVDRLGGIFLE